MEQEEKLRKITEYFGVETELTKLTEEIGELLHDCYEKHFTEKDIGIEDEMADVMVILAQLMIHFDIDIDKMNRITDEKIDRTLERIENGWYDKHR